MVEFGYALSSEEHHPLDLVKNARQAEEVGFSFAMISDHFHPWISRQGHSPFVWSVIGGIATSTQKLRLGTGVTCPTVRIHPAIIAQAAATSAAMMPGRFFLGVGSGEALNEHILGDHWPPAQVRLDMLEEAVEVIRLLWGGEEESFYGEFYTVENARIYTLPDEYPQLPPIYMASAGSNSAELAAKVADGLITVGPSGSAIEEYRKAGGKDPLIGQVKVCWAPSEEEALNTVYEWWPTENVPGSLHADLPTPDHFEDAAKLIPKEEACKGIACGPDREKHIQQIQEMIDQGFTHLYLHQIGPNQQGFFDFYKKEILPEFTKVRS